jgi:hypothetical protein
VLWGPGLEPSLPSEARSLWALLEWLGRYPQPSTEPADLPGVSDAVGVTAGSSAALVDALETIRQRGGRVRAWVVGDAELDLEAPVQRTGIEWPPAT